VKRDADTPAIRRRPDEGRADDDKDNGHEQRARPSDSEVDESDKDGQRQAIAEDGERPGVAGVALEGQAARGAAVEMIPAPE
jgi:hypothetical protein